MDEYKWSSHVFYKFNLNSILDIDYILDLLNEDRNLAIEKYTYIMNSKYKYNNEKDELFNRLDKILLEICNNRSDFELIKNGSKKSYLMGLKRKYINMCRNLGFSLKEIGESIGISERAVRKHLSKV
jgi:hypothetical protein